MPPYLSSWNYSDNGTLDTACCRLDEPARMQINRGMMAKKRTVDDIGPQPLGLAAKSYLQLCRRSGGFLDVFSSLLLDLNIRSIAKCLIYGQMTQDKGLRRRKKNRQPRSVAERNWRRVRLPDTRKRRAVLSYFDITR